MILVCRAFIVCVCDSEFTLDVIIPYRFLYTGFKKKKKKTGNHTTPETARYIGRQLYFYPSVLLGQTLTNFLSIFIYMYMKDWKGSHLSNQKCCMDH